MYFTRFLTGLIGLLLLHSATGQTTFWQDVSSIPSLGRQDDPSISVKHERIVSIRLQDVADILSSAPSEDYIGKGRSALSLSFPMPDGSSIPFDVYRSPAMAPGLAARYPGIQSFRAIDSDDDNQRGRFDYGPDGFSAVLITPEGEVWIDPVATAEDLYRVYYARDLEIQAGALPDLSCGTDPIVTESYRNTASGSIGRSAAPPVDLRVYTMALACTGEYAQTKGGTVEDVLSSMNRALNRLNLIYEYEVAIRFVLMENNDRLIWLDPETDPFTNASNGIGLLNQINNAFTTIAGIPVTAFDLGHLFTVRCTDVGGVVDGLACNLGRERGVTCHVSGNVNIVVRQVMAHEIGHQFTASHTFNNCPGSIDQLATGAAMEPGSGSTIMSYAGTCGNQNVLIDKDDYFHVRSLEQIISYSRRGEAQSCPSLVNVGNTEPVISLDYPEHFFIPISTPLQLTAAATDDENDPITYCWEEYDTGPVSDLGNPVGNAPLFRSLRPTTSPTRILPRPSDLVNNMQDPREVLPDYERDITFRVTVRDNHPGAGAAVWEEIKFSTTESAGPFRVLSPDVDIPTWSAGSYQEVSWDVANTDSELINCRFVNILLSNDGGFNYPFTLAARVPNTGSALVAVPDIETTDGRVKVEAVDNIFFNISTRDFFIEMASTPAFTVAPDLYSQTLCLPATAEFTFESNGVLGFAEEISLEVVDGLPEGATAAFTDSTIMPGETTSLQIELPDRNNSGRYEVTVRATANGTAPIEQILFLDLVSNDFSDVVMLNPADGAGDIGLTTELSWSGSDKATAYQIQIATNPGFGPASLIDEATVTAGNLSYTPAVLFEENTLYYWRMRPVNECGPAAFVSVQTFHTEIVDCLQFSSDDTPVVLPGSGLPTKESFIEVTDEGIISDVNIPIVSGNYQPVSSLRISLISPAGTEVILFDGNCGNTTDLLLGFDDDAPGEISCPPDDGIVFRPEEPLNAFVGENIQGTWTLRAKVIEAGFGGVGSIGDWSLEFCASLQPLSPVLITNDTLYVPPTLANPITAGELEVRDEDNTPDELSYTLVTIPQSGTLYYLDQPLKVGDTFLQSTINDFKLYYQHDGTEPGSDGFIFVVEDGTGGWIPPQEFHIIVDENAVVAVGDPEPLPEVELFPNPASSGFTIRLPQALEQRGRLVLFDMHGRRLQQLPLPQGTYEHWVDSRSLPAGIYWIQLQLGKHVLIRRVIVQ